MKYGERSTRNDKARFKNKIFSRYDSICLVVASFFPNKPMNFGKLFFLEVFSPLHLFDNFSKFFVMLPVFTVFYYNIEKSRVLLLELHVFHPYVISNETI
jgi:hypothetical protein